MLRANASPLAVGVHVKIKTKTYGCYHGKTGVIESVCNRTGENIAIETTKDKDPYWFQVKFDTPADNGGHEVFADIMLASELTPIS